MLFFQRELAKMSSLCMPFDFRKTIIGMKVIEQNQQNIVFRAKCYRTNYKRTETV